MLRSSTCLFGITQGGGAGEHKEASDDKESTQYSDDDKIDLSKDDDEPTETTQMDDGVWGLRERAHGLPDVSERMPAESVRRMGALGETAMTLVSLHMFEVDTERLRIIRSSFVSV